MLVHNVYFALTDNSEDKIHSLIADALQYLKNDPGLVHFAVARRALEFNRAVNDQDFDVCLNTVFKDKEAHDNYQISANHLEFVDKNKANFKSLRVCDAYTE